MRIVVMGAGGVGGYFGGRLVLAGNDVTFVARGPHGEAIRRKGLRAEGTLGEFHVQPAKCVASPDEIAEAPDVILFAVKLSAMESAAEQLRPIIGAQTSVYTVQNGVEAADVVGAVLGRRKGRAGDCLHLRDHFRARIDQHACGFRRSCLRRAGLPRERARKSLFRRLQGGEIRRANSARHHARHLAEIRDARADGGDDVVDPLRPRADPQQSALARAVAGAHRRDRRARESRRRQDARPGCHRYAEEFLDGLPPAVRASMAHDLEVGNPLELPWLSGAVVQLGDQHGVATPTHRFFADALAPYEKGRPE